MRGTTATLACAAVLGRLPGLWCLGDGRADPADVKHLGTPSEATVSAGCERRFEPLGQMSVVTERSVWLVRVGAYYRMPKDERPRPQDRSIEGRMDDGRWHGYRKVWWFRDGFGLGMRLHPVAGPPGGRGIFSGIIVAVHGSWALLAEDDTDA